jgi:hypothetical protein
MDGKLAALAAVLIDDETVVSATELEGLFAAFATIHPQAVALETAFGAKPIAQPNSEWLAERAADAVFMRAATDLALTVLFGAVFVDKVTVNASDPAWAFTGRFWTLTQAHPPALSAGPFGHWAYRPGPQ